MGMGHGHEPVNASETQSLRSTENKFLNSQAIFHYTVDPVMKGLIEKWGVL